VRAFALGAFMLLLVSASVALFVAGVYLILLRG
jgi:hypothetical protein